MSARLFWKQQFPLLLVHLLSMAALAVTGTEGLVLLFMGVAASCYGGLASLLTPLTARMFGPRYITENYGVMYIVFGLASLIGPVLAVRLRTPDGAYTWAFAAAAVLAAVGLILNCIVPLTAGKEAPHGK